MVDKTTGDILKLNIIEKKLRRLFIERHRQLKTMKPTPPFTSIKLPEGMPVLPNWFLRRLDLEVTASNDFVEITDSHYSHHERYLDYDSRDGHDYDEVIDFMLEQLNKHE
ncbi:MAG TPA: hypothetical protein ENH82_04070 [bacterium]|nr:hypothetical protein [bacterium]